MDEPTRTFRAEGNEATVRRAIAVSRNRRRPSYSNRNRPIPRLQRQENISAAFSDDSDRLPCRWYEPRRRPGSEFVGMARFLKLLPEHPLPNVRPAMK